MKWSYGPNWYVLIILMPKIKLVSFNLVLRVLKHFCTGIHTHILESDFYFTAFMVLIRIEWCQKPMYEIGSVIWWILVWYEFNA